MVKFFLLLLPAWLQSNRCNAVGTVWVTRVSQPDAEAHKSVGASHCMGYVIKQHKNMCAHTGMGWGCFQKCIYSRNVPQVPEHRAATSVWLQALQEQPACDVVAWYAQVVQERLSNRWPVRRRLDGGVPVFSLIGYKHTETVEVLKNESTKNK